MPGQTILIIDDESIADLLAVTVKAAGYEFAIAGDGIHAMSLVRQVKPALILLDYLFPLSAQAFQEGRPAGPHLADPLLRRPA